MEKSLHQILLEKGWHNEMVSGFTMYRFYLFGLTVSRAFHLEELNETGEKAEKIAHYTTEKAMYDLVTMMYQALYEKGRKSE